jgi:hypothetical protein
MGIHFRFARHLVPTISTVLISYSVCFLFTSRRDALAGWLMLGIGVLAHLWGIAAQCQEVTANSDESQEGR